MTKQADKVFLTINGKKIDPAVAKFESKNLAFEDQCFECGTEIINGSCSFCDKESSKLKDLTCPICKSPGGYYCVCG